VRPGTVVVLPDGREGTVVYHGLDGYGIRWGRLPLSQDELAAILNGSGNLLSEGPPEGFSLTPEAMLRAPYPSADLECVGDEYELADALNREAENVR